MKIIVNENGFTYIFVLTVVMIMGVMLGMVGQSWKTIKQRELEEEMIFRGDQVAELVYQRLLCKGYQPSLAIQFLWTVNSPNGTILDDLVIGREEACFGGKPPRKFRLRASAVLDPLTNKQWQIIKPVGDATRFSGVASSSGIEPFRKSFKTMYDSPLLDEKKQYRDWLFTWELKQTSTQNQNLKR